ncbi:MAG: HlyD family efflux transporter periplasmic adaptor subunit [Burkholderiales bacterium]|nr:HlyD family efflux transporter periplasmic adaptor subunit [Burkholderiales bacterium]
MSVGPPPSGNDPTPAAAASAPSAPDGAARAALYRKEALAHQRERAWGELIVSTPRAARWLAWGGVALAVLFIVFLAQAHYTRKARAPAVLAYASDPVLVAATEAGTVQSIDVREGDAVRAGQRLATISTERTAGGEAIFAASGRDAEARRAAIALERRQAQALLTAQHAQLSARIEALAAETAQLGREIAAQQERVTALKAQVERYRQLARERFAPELQVQQKEDELAEQAVRLESLRRTRAGLERDTAAARTELPALRASTEGKLAALARDEAALAQSTRESLARRAYDVTAASDGRVERVVATRGQSVIAGAPLLQMQTGAPVLLADIYVPSRSVGFLRVGQSVRLALDAFPMARFGHVGATVSEIGRSVIAPGDPGLPSGIREPVFRVRAALSANAIDAYGERWPLRAGLAAEADVALDSRPLYLWLVEPILRLRGRL